MGTSDVIEDCTIELDGGYGDDGHIVKAFLRLDGDFVRTCEKYLADTEGKEPFIYLELPRGIADDLYKSLREVVGG